MFNVTVLRMKDIIKYFTGIIATILIVIVISKCFSKNTKDEQTIIQNIENGVKSLSENNLLECLNKTIPVISQVNEEYNAVAKEDDINTDDNNILEIMIQTQISSIKAIDENKDNSQIENNKQKQSDVVVAEQQDIDSNQEQSTVQTARNRANN